jgi:hypothetical protein
MSRILKASTMIDQNLYLPIMSRLLVFVVPWFFAEFCMCSFVKLSTLPFNALHKIYGLPKR